MAISLHTNDLQALLHSAREAGYSVVAPVREEGVTLFKTVKSAEEIVLDEILPTKSPKEYFLAEHETILTYNLDGGGKMEIADPPEEELSRPTVLFGVRPCDAAALPIMNRVMTWDYDDAFFLKRRDSAVVVAIACVEADESCFCTSVGLAPDSREGADIILTPSAEETGAEQEYSVEVVTERGQELIEKTKGWGNKKSRPSAAIEKLKASLGPRFDPERVREWLEGGFDDEFWRTATLACLGCGTCTFLCPTCHCFDIVDEGDTRGGRRVKNWDSCQMSLFTLHASGHNPRPDQWQRYRQRIMHKFRYYPELFGRILCTGCGRCQRSCPADMAMVGILEKINQLAIEVAAT